MADEPSTIYQDWMKNVDQILKKGELKKEVPSQIKRCPKCNNLSLEFDPENNRIHCTKCGFVQHLKQ